METRKAERIAKALSDPNRMKIIMHIKERDMPFYCSELDEIVDLAQPSICHHMKQLTDAEIVISQKEGRSVKYSINAEVLDEYISFLDMLRRRQVEV